MRGESTPHSVAPSLINFRTDVDWLEHPWSRVALTGLLVAAVYYVAATLSLAFRVPSTQFAIIWVSNPILLTVFLLSPPNKWPLWILAAAPAHALAHVREAAPPLLVACAFLADIAQVGLAAYGLRYFARTDDPCRLDTLRKMAVFILIAVIGAPAVVSFSAAWLFFLWGWETNYMIAAPARFLSSVVTGFVVLPLLFAVARGSIEKFKCVPRRTYGEFAVLVLVLTSVLATTSVYSAEVKDLPWELYVSVPFLIWVAARYGPAGVSFTLLIVAGGTLFETMNGRGAFVQGSPVENLFSLEIFLAVLAVPMMLLASSIEEAHDSSAALTESEARFRKMTDTAPVMIWMIGADKLCTFVNKKWLDFRGGTLERELGHGWTEGLHPDDLGRFDDAFASSFSARQEFTIEYRLQRSDGEYRWLVNSGVPRLEDDGTFLGYLGSCVDITERKRAEAELHLERQELAHISRLSTMGELAASLAHELHQPLTAILSNAQAAQRFIAADSTDLDEVREILADIIQDNSRAAEVIRRMRSLVKKEGIELAAIELSTIIQDVILLTRTDAMLHNIRVLLDLGPGLPPVRGDRVQLQQVLLNLLLNAFDAMGNCPANQREITVRAKRDSGQVEVSVSDQGTGLTPHALERIFQPFFTTKRDGLGMGLAISRSIIEAHGGRLGAKNNVGRGATFGFILPAAE
jgi:PAS domain S-box-containing protein